MDPVLTAGAVAGAILALSTLAGLAWRGSRRAARIADAILGAPAQDGLPERLGVVRQLELLRGDLADHLTWHAGHIPDEPSSNGGHAIHHTERV